MGGDDTKTYQQSDARETERFWTKIWQPRKTQGKSRIDKQYDKKITRACRGPES